MDDLLIVRMSDRARSRTARRHEPIPIGAAFGLVCGAAFGLAFAQSVPSQPELALALGIGIGLALGGLFGRFLKPGHRARPRPSVLRSHYDGMPFEAEETEAPESDARK